MVGWTRYRVAFLVTAIAVVTAPSASQGGTALRVDDDAPAGGDGQSWATALRFLQDALAVAAGSDRSVSEIRVAQGTYVPDRDEIHPDGTGDRQSTFSLITGVAMRGGFAGLGASDPDRRDWRRYETILSGDLQGDDDPDFANREDNSLHVVTGSGTLRTAVLDGFSITAGFAIDRSCGTTGGGMLNENGHATVINCIFCDNVAGESGGAMYNSGSAPAVVNCSFTANVAFGCATPGLGGGMYNKNSNPDVTNCVFADNASGVGGGIFSYQSSPMLVNCTFTGNEHYGLADSGSGHSTVLNCIFWDNGTSFIWNAPNPPTVAFSNVEGGFEGTGNIDADPLFVDPDNGDYRLLPGSPCIDAGDTTAVPEEVVMDLAGSPRLTDDPDTPDTGLGDPPVVDMGAFEFQPCPWDLTGDGVVDFFDLVAVIFALGPCDDPRHCTADIDGDGFVGVLDLLGVLANFGPCPGPATCPWDLDGDGLVGLADIQILVGHSGPCKNPDNCPGDFNGDGAVNVFDKLALILHFGPCS